MTESVLIIAIGMVVSNQAREEATAYAPLIMEQSQAYEIDPMVVVSIIAHESRFNASAIGKDGKDFGLMQLRRTGSCLENYTRMSNRSVMRPAFNITVGVACVRRMVDRCGGDLAKGLSKYNGRGCKRSIYSRTILGTAQRLKNAMLLVREGTDGGRSALSRNDSVLARNLAGATLHN